MLKNEKRWIRNFLKIYTNESPEETKVLKSVKETIKMKRKKDTRSIDQKDKWKKEKNIAWYKRMKQTREIFWMKSKIMSDEKRRKKKRKKIYLKNNESKMEWMRYMKNENKDSQE